MKNKVSIFCLVFVLLSVTIVFAVDHTTDDHYTLLPISWKYEGVDATLHVSYFYQKNGSYNFGYRVSQAADAWNDYTDSPFDMHKASSRDDADLYIDSDDYGNTSWLGICYWIKTHRDIKINDYKFKEDNYSYSQFEEVIAHEMGHAHGLSDISSCDDELMRGKGLKGSSSPYKGDIAGINNKY